MCVLSYVAIATKFSACHVKEGLLFLIDVVNPLIHYVISSLKNMDAPMSNLRDFI